MPAHESIESKKLEKHTPPTCENNFFVKKMTISGHQPLSLPPPSDIHTRQEPPSYEATRAPAMNTSSKMSWLDSIFNSFNVPTPHSSTADSATNLQSTTTSRSIETAEVNLAPLPPTYDPQKSTPTLHSSASTTSLASLSTISTTSTLAPTPSNIISTQPRPHAMELPRYEAIQASRPSTLHRTLTKAPSSTSTSSTSTSSTSTTPYPSLHKTKAKTRDEKKSSWKHPFASTDLHYVDPYEEYEIRQRAERERAAEKEGSRYCCGCFYVGGTLGVDGVGWQGHYVF